jgi:hypothetical protein
VRATLLVVVAALVAAGSADAATYTVSACDGPNATGPNRLFATYGSASPVCDAGNGLHAQLTGPLPAFTASGYRMTAPAGTSIDGYSADYGVDWSARSAGQWVSMIDAGDGVPLSMPCPAGGCSPSLPAVTPYARWGPAAVVRSGLSAQALRLHVACGSSCPNEAVHPWWSHIRVALSDGSAPAVSGALDADGWLSGTHALAWSARDNSGIRRTRLEVDGGATSDDARSCDYSYAVPCSDTAGAYSIDTTQLTDGIHRVAVRAFDATDQNSGTLTSRLLVDNLPPVTKAAGMGSPDRAQPGPVTVTLSARDAGAGMGGGHIDYRLEGAPEQRAAADHVAIAVGGDGAHTISFRAYDAVGHASAERTVVVRIGGPADALAGPGAGFSDRALNPGSTFTAARSFASSCPDNASLQPVRRAYFGGRALVAFALPASGGCSVASAQMRVDATRATTVTAQRLAGAWDEEVTWGTRPGTTGEPVTAAGGPGSIDLDVTDLVADIYRYGDDGLALDGLAEQELDGARLTVAFE